MKEAPVTALFLDVGGVLLTNGWDRHARERAAKTFDLDRAEMDERHHLTFDTYEVGKLTLEEYLARVVFYRDRSFTPDQFRTFMFEQSKPFPDMINLVSRLKARHRLKMKPNEGDPRRSMDTSHENRELVSHAHLPRVVIVGGGFGGLYAARGLARAPVTVTVVDKHNYHLFRPMLYQVATGLLSSDEVAAPIRSILRRQKNVTVLMAEVVGVDPHARVVFTREGTVAYDYLVLATGIEYNYFGHEEWKALAPGLASVDDADRIRGKILTAFESAERLAASGKADASILHELLTFVQVGAGTAGVEMAGTVAEMTRMALAEDFRHIDPRSAHILLFEAAPRILPTYPESLSEKARRHLEQLGVEVHTNAQVERVDEHGVIVNGERIASRTVLWTAGVVASPAGRWLGVDVDRAGRIKVNPDLSVPGHPNVFAVGDTAAITPYTRSLFGIRSKTPELLPGVAQVAIQGGAYVASLIRRRVNGERSAKPFWYWDKGDMAIVGRTFAVADLKHVRFSGFTAWLLWAGIHIYFLIGFANRLLVMLQWAISFVTKRRGVRILPLAQTEMTSCRSGPSDVRSSDVA